MFNFEGCKCVVCRQTLHTGEDIVVCPDCGAPYHRDCYDQKGVCLFKEQHGPEFEWKPGPDECPQQEPAADAAQGEAVPCPRCGHRNAAADRSCGNCGMDLAAAPAWEMPYGSGDDQVDGIALTDWAAYIGAAAPNYLLSFKRMEITGRKIGFSLGAFMFGPLYFFYRKVWGAAILFSALSLLTELPAVLAMLVATESPLVAGLDYAFLVRLSGYASIASWVLRVAASLLATHLYRKDATAKIRRILDQYPAGRDRQTALALTGGISMAAVILAVLAFFLLCYCLAMLAGPNLDALYNMLYAA